MLLVALVTFNQCRGFSKPRAFLMKVLRNLLLLDMSIQKHVLFLANILCTNNPHTACANQKVFVRTA